LKISVTDNQLSKWEFNFLHGQFVANAILQGQWTQENLTKYAYLQIISEAVRTDGWVLNLDLLRVCLITLLFTGVFGYSDVIPALKLQGPCHSFCKGINSESDTFIFDPVDMI